MDTTDDLPPDALIRERITVHATTGAVRVHRSVGQSTKQMRVALTFFKRYASVLQRVAIAAERATRKDMNKFQQYDAQIDLARAVAAYREWLANGNGPTFEERE